MFRRKPATVRATFPNGRMMFGTGYKYWHQQLGEYCWQYRSIPLVVVIADVEFPGAGIKWMPWGTDFLNECLESNNGIQTLDDLERRFRCLRPNESAKLGQELAWMWSPKGAEQIAATIATRR